MIGRNIELVTKFIESKGGCNSKSADLYNEFITSNIGINKNTLKVFSRKKFEITMKKVCKKNNGKVTFNTSQDKKNNDKTYIVEGTINIHRYV